MPRVNKSQYAILGVLSLKPLSAYGIKTFMQRTTQHFWSESEAQIYPTIKKLCADGLLNAREEKAEKAGNKKIYTLTDKGKKVLQEWLKKNVDAGPYRNEHLLKIFFGCNQSLSANINLLNQWKDESTLTLNILKETRDTLLAKAITDEQKCCPLLTLEYGISMLETKIRWCRKSIRTLRKVMKDKNNGNN